MFSYMYDKKLTIYENNLKILKLWLIIFSKISHRITKTILEIVVEVTRLILGTQKIWETSLKVGNTKHSDHISDWFKYKNELIRKCP